MKTFTYVPCNESLPTRKRIRRRKRRRKRSEKKEEEEEKDNIRLTFTPFQKHSNSG